VIAMDNEADISLRNLTKRELLLIGMGINHMKKTIMEEHWEWEMYGAALQVSEKIEQAMKECGIIKTIEYEI